MATNFGTGSNRTIFSDGEGLTSGDLTDISKNAIRRAWEVPGVASILAFDALTGTYNDAFKSATALSGRNYGVFTIGGGLCPQGSGNASSVDRGVIGIWTESTAVTLPAASGNGKVLWGLVDTTGGIAVTHDNPDTDKYRWDLISVSASEADIAVVTRDYKDSTTGAETSEDVVTAKKVQFAYTVTKGTEGAVGAVTVPAAPEGERYLYAVKLEHGASVAAIVDIQDFTIPVGNLTAVFQRPYLAWWNNTVANWALVTGGALESAHSGQSDIAAFVLPEPANGNAATRILGLVVTYKFKTGTTVKLMRSHCDGSTADAEVTDVSSSFVCNNAVHTAALDLRGLPNSNSIAPLWASGNPTKAPSYSGHADSLYLRVATAASGGDGSQVIGITWVFVG